MWHFLDFELEKIKGVSYRKKGFYLVFSNSWQIIGDIRFVKNKAVPPCYVALLHFLGNETEITFDYVADKVEVNRDSNGKINWLFIYIWGNAIKYRFNIAVGGNDDKSIKKSYFNTHLRYRGKRKAKGGRKTDLSQETKEVAPMIPPY